MRWLGNRRLKRQLVNVLSDLLPDLVAELLSPGQTFVVAGGFDDPTRKDRAELVLMTDNGPEKRVAGEYFGKHGEADTRVWLHAERCAVSPVVI